MGKLKLTKILTSVFNTLYAHVEFRKVKPVDYKLFQVADEQYHMLGMQVRLRFLKENMEIY